MKQERGRGDNSRKISLVANGRALTLEAEKTGGFVRVVARESDNVIRGFKRSVAMLPSCMGNLYWHWKWAPYWRTYQEQSMPTRQWQKHSMKVF